MPLQLNIFLQGKFEHNWHNEQCYKALLKIKHYNYAKA